MSLEGCGRKIGDFSCCTVICGDCLELMKAITDRTIGMVLLDPPFNLGKDYGGFSSDRMPASEYQTWLAHLLCGAFRVAAPDSVAYCFHCDAGIFMAKPLAEAAGWSYVQTLIWYGPNGFRGYTAAQKSPKWSYCHEAILYLQKGSGIPAIKEPRWFMSVIPAVRPQTNFKEGRSHVAQKPIRLYERLINFHDSFEKPVLDPCAGSGSSLVASKSLGDIFWDSRLAPPIVGSPKSELR
jgi:site-specific DNA-methyltransferase (adenine-specific)